MVCIKTNKVRENLKICMADKNSDDKNGHHVKIYWQNRFRLLCDGTEDTRSMRIICARYPTILGNEYYYFGK